MKSKSSRRWLDEHFSDSYVKKAKQEGHRSRAAYKLLEINHKDRILRTGMAVVDLGAAPGGWSQVAANIVGDQGKVIASDILPMDTLPGVDFVQGDFRDEATLSAILTALDDHPAGLVISDMAPNITGTRSVDQPRMIYLAELALELARDILSVKGDFLIKVFQGEGFDQYLKELRSSFDRVLTRKPDSSRPRSRELYLLARGYKRVQ
ncbi:MAG: 23S rRNA (uridine(2552)-2'-O)-methyltransferase RlmE [Gammaproteobacteria bacterium]|nr:23S rRNA (uridine(2552)-2'-O)-methyltransferase RlmE [Gammaproteobacteria bacterium]